MRARALFLGALLALSGAGCVGIGDMGGLPEDGGPPIRPHDARADAPSADADTPIEQDADTPIERDADTPIEQDADTPVERDADPPVEPEVGPPPCSYPTGPYAFNLGRVSPEMSWPYSTALDGSGDHADFEELHCDPEVRSVFLYVGNTT